MRDGLSNTLICGERASNIMFSSWTGSVYKSPYHFWLTLATAENPPNAIQKDQEFDLVMELGFSSNHPNVTVMTFADGSVVPISDDIDPQLFYSLGTSSGKEFVDKTDL